MRRLPPPAALMCLCVLGLSACATDYGASDPEVGGYEQRQAALGSAEYGPANWIASPNYYTGSRAPGNGKVSVIVVHTTQGSYSGTLSWFQNKSAQVSSHYVISKTGAVTQMVQEKDVAWHVGSENGYTIGIEHEGFVDDPNWITPQMWAASVQLTCYLSKKWGLAPNAAHIKGHVQLPNQTHVDPGKYWNYQQYFNDVAACVGGTPPPPPGPAGCCSVKAPVSGSAVIDDSGNDCIQLQGPGTSWWTGAVAGSNGGSVHYTYTSTKADAENWARWRLTFDKPGKYKVEAFVPSNFATAKPAYQIKHAGATSTVVVDQKPLSNVWVDLGTYDFAANCDEFVVAGDNTGQAYDKAVMLGIDAVKVTAVAPQCAGSCDDGNACTDDSCQNGQCAHAPNTGATCWDGDACTVGEKCSAGQCVGGKITKDCNDNNPCTDDGCSASNCTHVNNGAACDDGNACTSGDHCQGGACGGGGGATCDDGNPCTTDACQGGNCTHASAGGTCSDGNACTSGDHCQGGKCVAAPINCDDGDACNGTESCVNGGCVAGGTVDCNDGNPCTDDACLGGSCQHGPNAAPCDDGNACTQGDTCGGGACQAGPGKLCDDGNPCTKDGCLQGVCVTQILAGACDDGDFCTEGDYCAQGLCLAGGLKTCDDGLACTQDSCQDGKCQHAGDVKPAVKTCKDGSAWSTDPCGGPDTEVKCPAHAPCKDGVCVSEVDAEAADSGNGDAAAEGDATPRVDDGSGGDAHATADLRFPVGDAAGGADARSVSTVANSRASGCTAGTSGSAGGVAMILLCLGGLVVIRRRSSQANPLP